MIAPRLRAADRALRRDRSGIAVVEFALSLPLLLALTMYGLETVHLAYSAQKLGDIAVLAADNIGRIRVGIGEADVTETLDGVKGVGQSMPFGRNGRIIVSSLRPVINPTTGAVTNQRIRWQRCTGALRVASSYGQPDVDLGVTGMGPTGRKVAAAADAEVIFVEVAYAYQPLISRSLIGGARTMRAIAATNVRERKANDIQAGGAASLCTAFPA